MKLTTEQKNILIAEKMGFEQVQPHPDAWFDGRLRHMVDGDWQWFNKDYFTDLNACAEVESKLSTSGMISQRDNYDCRLLKICGTHSAAISATAAQRAEAIGVVLKLWEAGE